MDLCQLAFPETLSESRLDLLIFKLVEDVPSRNFAARLIEAGAVQVNGKPSKPSRKIVATDTVTLDLECLLGSVANENAVPQAERIPLHIVYEDEDLLVVNKAAGMVVHPGAGVSTGTLVNAVLNHCGSTLPSLGKPMRAGIVHRLDKETSGLIVVAKSQLALTSLSAQFAAHSQRRIYGALAFGVPTPKTGRIETFHARDPRNRLRFAVFQDGQGKFAALNYTTLGTFWNDQASFVECVLQTGRTHQIRVQMTHIGCPLLGDSLYGQVPGKIKNQKELWAALKPLLTRQMLHARHLGFIHPRTLERLAFDSAFPPDFDAVRNLLANFS